MQTLLRKSALPLGITVALCCLLGIIIAVLFANRVNAQSAQSSGQRLITIHDQDSDRSILTTAGTLRQAFENSGIRIDPSDLVEPGLDEALVATSYEVNIYRARPITVIDGTVRQRVMSPYQTAKQIAEHAGITLHDEDKTELIANTDIVSEGTGMRMTIDRATPFTLVLYGKKTTAYTQEDTVAKMLESKKINVGGEDTLSVDKNSPITSGMTVELWRNGKQTVTEEQNIDFPVEKIKDADREVGYRQVKTPGEVGKRSVTYEVEMKNGQEVSRKEIQSIVDKEPVKQVEIVGAKQTNTFGGSFGDALARLRSCEGSYTSNTGNGYYGAYQFDIQTWGGYGGFAVASDAPPSVQDEKAWLTYQRRGWNPWPSCSKKMGLQDIYR